MYKNIFKVTFTLFLLAVVPVTTLAATVFIKTNSPYFHAEDKILVPVRLNTEGVAINSIEGLMSVYSPDTTVHVTQIDLSGSDFLLWPEKPSVSFSNGNSSISFTGGVPQGINKSDALLFTIALSAEKPGNVFINPASFVAFANDGKGTPVRVNTSEFVITAEPARTTPIDELKEQQKKDSEPPAPFSVDMGQDPSVFEGRKFISYFTSDAGSGIDHYEVQEGSLEPVRSSSPYILRHQAAEETIIVTAFDKAGNSRSAQWSPTTERDTFLAKSLLLLLSLIICLICCIMVWQWRQKSKRIKH